MEWIHEGLPYFNEPAEVWLDNGEVRRVIRPYRAGGIYFTDCTHPMQNVICDEERIKAWRIDEASRPGATARALHQYGGWGGPPQMDPLLSLCSALLGRI